MAFPTTNLEKKGSSSHNKEHYLDFHEDDTMKDNVENDTIDGIGRKRKRNNVHVLTNNSNRARAASLSLGKKTIEPDYASNFVSIENLLSVPESFVFYSTNVDAANGLSQQNKVTRHLPLLSRGEATVLLRSSQLAFELDILMNMAIEALYRHRKSRDMYHVLCDKGRDNEIFSKMPKEYFRAILPALDMHGSCIPNQVLELVQRETNRILTSDLRNCAVALNQFAEQNWSVAEHLDSVMTLSDKKNSKNENSLIVLKRIVAEVEETICKRIEALIVMASPERVRNESDELYVDAFKLATNEETDEYIPMATICNNLMDKFEFDKNKVINQCHKKKSNNTGEINASDSTFQDNRDHKTLNNFTDDELDSKYVPKPMEIENSKQQDSADDTVSSKIIPKEGDENGLHLSENHFFSQRTGEAANALTIMASTTPI